MTTPQTVLPPNAHLPPRQVEYAQPKMRRTRSLLEVDRGLSWLAWGSACVVIAMLLALVLFLAVAAWPSVKRFGPGFLVTNQWRANALPVLKRRPNGKFIRDPITGMKVVDHYLPPVFGAVAPIAGTATTAALALIVSVPLSLGASLFLVRIAPQMLVGPVSFLIEFLAAIPSIAYGLWGMFVLSVWLGGPARWSHPLGGPFAGIGWPVGIESHLFNLIGHWRIFHWLFYAQVEGRDVLVPLTGRDVFCGGLILGIMVIPIITAISRDILRNVPLAQIEGTIALGATWWQSAKEMLKYSRSGLFGAIMLGLARAAGETMAVLMVMGSTAQVAVSPFLPGTTLAATVAGKFPESSDDPIHRGVLMELALILLVMSLIFNVAARYLVVGGASRTSAAH